MDLNQTPTVTDLARMLDTIPSCSDGGYPETRHVLRWLVESTPRARELRDRLHAPRPGEPSLIELARLIIAVEDGEPFPEAVYTARWMIESSAPAGRLYKRLEQMATDAGLDSGDSNWAVRALEFHRELDRLLATLDDWRDARGAIELETPEEYTLECLLKVCRARMVHARGAERQRLERLRHRLRAAAQRAAFESNPEERLKEITDSLLAAKDPESTLRTIDELTRPLRKHRD